MYPRSYLHFLAYTLVAQLPILATGQAVITLSSGSNTLWTAVGGQFDYITDQQTGQGADDIVGSDTRTPAGMTDPGFLTAFYDAGQAGNTGDFIGFRVRMSRVDAVNQGVERFEGYLWVGVDADQNGSVDAYIRYSGKTDDIGIHGPGTGLNISPNTTTIDANATTPYFYDLTQVQYQQYVDYRAVFLAGNDWATTTDFDGGGSADYYVSFQLPFSDLLGYLSTKGITQADGNPLNENSPLRYVLATSTQGNSFNQDVGGLNGYNKNSAVTWEQEGFGNYISGNGQVLVPEASSALLLMMGGLGLLLRRRR